MMPWVAAVLPARHLVALHGGGPAFCMEGIMPNLVPSNPFSEFARWNPFRDFEDVLGPRGVRAVIRDMPDDRSFKMNVSESPEWYRVRAALPGVNKDDIRVTIDGNVVTISAEAKHQAHESPAETVLCTEYYAGKKSRSFMLRHDIDDMKASARYADGVLDLMLPKKVATTARQLAVH